MTTERSVLSRYIDPEVLGRIAQRPFEPRDLVAGSLAGAHKSPFHGFAVEFAGHREYTWGDDPKHIDWRVFFTRDKYMIKQYEMETNLVCHLVLDVSASMRYGDDQRQKLLWAARMATSLGYAIVRQSDRVSFATVDRGVTGFLPPSDSMAQIVRATEHLESVEPSESTDLAASLTELVGRFRSREIVLVFSDLFTDLERLEEALQRLRYRKHEVVLFWVLHPDELRFGFEGCVKFVGIEEPGDVVLEAADVRSAYLEALGRFRGAVESMALRNRVELVPVDTGRDLAGTLADYLSQRRSRR